MRDERRATRARDEILCLLQVAIVEASAIHGRTSRRECARRLATDAGAGAGDQYHPILDVVLYGREHLAISRTHPAGGDPSANPPCARSVQFFHLQIRGYRSLESSSFVSSGLSP